MKSTRGYEREPTKFVRNDGLKIVLKSMKTENMYGTFIILLTVPTVFHEQDNFFFNFCSCCFHKKSNYQQIDKKVNYTTIRLALLCFLKSFYAIDFKVIDGSLISFLHITTFDILENCLSKNLTKTVTFPSGQCCQNSTQLNLKCQHFREATVL